MASKLIRGDMLDSERVHGVSVEARWLYFTILMLADDLGLYEENHFRLGRKAGLDQKSLQPLLTELVAADLVRPYKVAAKGFGFVPRYGQRLRIKRTKYPVPPLSLVFDDEDAINKINGLDKIPPIDGAQLPTQVRRVRPEPEPEPEPEEEIKRHTSVGKQRTPAAKTPRPKKAQPPKVPAEAVVAVYHEVLPELPRAVLMPARRAAALQKFWEWILSSKKSDGTPRATNPEEALAWARAYFERVRHNEFLMGTIKRSEEHANWRCSLDHLLTDKGMLHVIERTESS